MSVNVAAGELSRGALVDRVTRCLARIDVDPACLILEVTETPCSRMFQGAITTFDALQRAGVHVAIDDVGTGYTSLAYLRRLPIDILKIARPLVAELGDPNSSGELAGPWSGTARRSVSPSSPREVKLRSKSSASTSWDAGWLRGSTSRVRARPRRWKRC